MIHHPLFSALPSHGQIATQGNWETAHKFSRLEAPGREQIATYIQGEEAAFEAFFGNAFFGVRFQGDTEKVRQALVDSGNALRECQSGEGFFLLMAKIMGTGKLLADFDRLEFGAEGAWKSVGPYRILQPFHALVNFTKIWDELSISSVGRNETRPKALEVAFKGKGTPHWFGLPISSDTPPYEISKEQVLEAFKAFHEYVANV